MRKIYKEIICGVSILLMAFLFSFYIFSHNYPAEIEESCRKKTSSSLKKVFEKKVFLLKQNEIWSGKIFISGVVVVPEDVTLIIKPGTIVKFRRSRDYRELSRGLLAVVGGTLKAIGTPEEQIWFTSDASKPINGDWAGIYFLESKTENVIDYAIVEFAQLGIELKDSSASISNSIIRWMNSEGIYLERSNAVIRNNTIYGNGCNGIAMEQFNYNVSIRNNKILNNQIAGIHGEATDVVVESNIITSNKFGATFDDFSNARIRNNLIENNKQEGIHFYFKTRGELSFNAIKNNKQGVSCFKSWLVARNNDISDNREANLEAGDMYQLDVKKNWWGKKKSGAVKETIRCGQKVLFEPFLIESGVEIEPILFDYRNIIKTELDYTISGFHDRYAYIYSEKDETRRVVKKISAGIPSGFGWSLCWDGCYLWKFKYAGGGELLKIDPKTGQIITSFNNPDIAQPHGITFDGESLWINDFTSLKIFEVDPENGTICSSFDIPNMGSGASGITWDGEYLYLVNWRNQKELYKVDRKGNFMGILELEGDGGQTITFDGSYFWVALDNKLYGKWDGKWICKYDRKGNLIGRIYPAAEGTWAMAHDGKYLWTLQRTCENWMDPKIYQIEILDDSLPEDNTGDDTYALYNNSAF